MPNPNLCANRHNEVWNGILPFSSELEFSLRTEICTRFHLLVGVILFGTLTGNATSNPNPETQTSKPRFLDTAGIRKVYLDGDFDEAVERIESALRKGGLLSHEDSVFVFKHLGVMYTAKYETREKGKSYLVRLLQVEPGARIVDMFASDMIYMIFKNICDEYDMYQSKLKMADKQSNGGNGDGTQGKKREEAGSTSLPEGKSRRFAWVGWTAGALAAAGGVALLVALTADDAPDHENIVP